jgi:hypothetical protein
MVPAASRRVSRVPRYSGATKGGLHFRLRGYHPLWPAFPGRSTNAFLSLVEPLAASGSRRPLREMMWSYNPELSLRIARFGLVRFRSPLLSESRLISFPPGTEMVHFPGFASCTYGFSARSAVFAPRGFPHSEIPGSQIACISPGRIAAGCVLPRLIAPRHPHACP